MKKNFSSEDVENILKKYKEGFSSQKIGEIFGVSKSPIIKILKDYKILKNAKSNGKKIKLTENQKNLIKKLYLEDYKNAGEIAKIIGLTKSFIDKYLTNCGYRRSLGESISLRQKGKKRSDRVREILKNAQKKLSESGKRIQSGGVCTFYNVNNIDCQGTYEKFYIEKLIKENKKLPSKPEPIKTPFGVYNPDFYDGKYLIEIKSDYTYDVLIGNKKNRWNNKIDLTQYNKIRWANKNIRPVKILIVDKKNDKLIKKQIT